MNREERRAAVKKLTKKGLTKESAITFVKRIDSITTNPITTWEGEKVTLRLKDITPDTGIIYYPDPNNPKGEQAIDNPTSYYSL